MTQVTAHLPRLGGSSLQVATCALLATAACGLVVVVFGAHTRATASAAEPSEAVTEDAAAVPTAARFAEILTGTVNAYAAAHGETTHASNAHCVQASAGRYMCSFATKRRGHRSQCHVMQAKWTPKALSSYRVTLGGRATRCGTLRAALRSLK